MQNEFIYSGIIGYLLGSIPFGLLITKFLKLGDIRTIGSGNIGATNVLRTGNKKAALATLLFDISKGAIAVLITYLIYKSNKDSEEITLIAGFFAVLGHNFPIWLKFKGGKGVATTLGLLIATSFPAGIFTCATWFFSAFLFKYSSLAALISLGLSPIYGFLFASAWHSAVYGALALLAFIRHKKNIIRLIKKQEPKIGENKK